MCEDDPTGTPVAAVPDQVAAFTGEPVRLQPVLQAHITTLVDNAVDMLAADIGPAKRHPVEAWPRLAPARHQIGGALAGPLAEHGFSALVDVQLADGGWHRVLFDTGISPDGMVENMHRLGLDIASIEAVVCSHGHFDHTTGLDGLARALGGSRKLPALIHPDFWSKRRIALPGKQPWELPTTSRRGLAELGFDIIERPEPSFLLGGSVLITGEVARTTDFEQGFPIHQALRDGSWQPDPLILDDQALVINVRDRGLVVLTGCGHAGIVNVLRYARALTGVERVHAVLGGFHLTGTAFEPIIGPTVDGIAALEPDYLVPAHCTGWRAMNELAGRLPDAFIPNSIGTRVELVAPQPAAAG